MSNRNAVIPPPLPKTVKTPPLSKEAKAIARGKEAIALNDPEFEAFRQRLEDHINATLPTWRKVLYNLRKKFQR